MAIKKFIVYKNFQKPIDFLCHINYYLIVPQKVGDEDVATHRQT